jgi:hypothetical protein
MEGLIMAEETVDGKGGPQRSTERKIHLFIWAVIR